jgi:hypothetical protein
MLFLRPRRRPDVKECRLVSFVAMALAYGSPTQNSFLHGDVPVPVDGGVAYDACDDSSVP